LYVSASNLERTSFHTLYKNSFFLKKTPQAIGVALTWSVFVTVMLCLPGSSFPKKKWFDEIWLDKWVHICFFSVMVFLWCWVMTTLTWKTIRLFYEIAFYFFLYGVAMEFVQKYFIPNRSFDVMDMIADGIGGVIGVIIAAKVYIKK
jgi:VanZ family protein